MNFLPIIQNDEKVYAGFWRRFGSMMIDGLTFIPLFLLSEHYGILSSSNFIISSYLTPAIFWIYVIFFHYKYGATIGKMIFKIKISLPNGSKIGLKEALLRSSVDLAFLFLAFLALSIAFLDESLDFSFLLNEGLIVRTTYLNLHYPNWYVYIEFFSNIWVWSELLVLLFNKRKRAIHDYIAGTVVIKKKFSI